MKYYCTNKDCQAKFEVTLLNPNTPNEKPEYCPYCGLWVASENEVESAQERRYEEVSEAKV